MGNALAYLFGAISLIIVIPSTIPLLGWGNWIALPLIAIGLVFGLLSSSDGGFRFCAVIGVIAAVRLFIGGGFI